MHDLLFNNSKYTYFIILRLQIHTNNRIVAFRLQIYVDFQTGHVV